LIFYVCEFYLTFIINLIYTSLFASKQEYQAHRS